MRYQFPEIRTIDDVLPHIEGRDEFIIAERDYGTVINYAVAFEDTFPPVKVSGGSARMRAERALTNSMRRECRGLIFYPDGRIMSRPFHKFFNINEREETQTHAIDMMMQHVIMEKMDGSMIRPILVDGYVRWASKMGITSVAMQAEEFVAKNTRYKDFAIWCISEGLTPIFEWTSPFNQIVLPYEKENLTLLAVRDNLTGEYLKIQ